MAQRYSGRFLVGGLSVGRSAGKDDEKEGYNGKEETSGSD